MSALAFEITLISRRRRIVCSVIAHSAAQAIRIGIRMMSEFDAPCAVTCKPIRRIAT